MKKNLHLLLGLLIVAALVLPGIMQPAQAQGDRPIVMGSLVEVYTVDPAVGFDQAIGSSLKQLYDAPFRYVGNPPQVEPWLAESYEVSDDGLTYTISMHTNAVFHDGSPVDAEAVVYSAERLLRVNQGPASLFAGVLSPGNTVAADEHAVEFTLDQPYGPFLDILTWLFIVNPAVVEANLGDDDGVTYLTDHEAGSGPFTMGRWQPGELYEFVAVDDYWRGWPSENYPTSVTRVVMREASTRRLELESGNVDMVDWMTVPDMNALVDSGFTIAPCCGMTVYDIKLNTVEGPTADVHLRRAISYAIDYNAMLEIWEGLAPGINGPLPPGISTVEQPVYTFDLDKAREELAQSAYPDGVDLEYVYVTGLEEERLTGLVLQDSLAEIGIDVTITAVPWGDAVAMFADASTSPQMFPLYSLTAYANPDNYLYAAFHSSQAGAWTNPGHYSNSEVDALLEAARAEPDPDAQRAIYAQAEALIVEDAPNVFLAVTPEDKIVGPRVTNYAEAYDPVMGSTEDFYFYEVAN